MGHFPGADRVPYPAGLLLAALAAGGLVIAAAAPGTVSGLLGWTPLRWLGVRSYGIYLWHWPVIALAAAIAGPGSTGIGIWLIETAIAISLAAASWRWIEEPIIHNGFRATVLARHRVVAESAAAARQSPARAFPALFMVAALSVACTAGYGVLNAPSPDGLRQQIMHAAKVSAATQARHATVPRTPHVAAGSPAPTPTPAETRPPATGNAGQGAQPVAQRPIPGSMVTAIGDSVMLAAAPQLQDVLPGIYINAQVSRQMSAGLALVHSLADSGLLRPVVVVGPGHKRHRDRRAGPPAVSQSARTARWC